MRNVYFAGLAAVLLVLPSMAAAQTCTIVGNNTICTDGSSSTQVGGTTIHSGGGSCTQVGNSIICN
ncbi:MAG: hypothetical protein RIT52_2226 [Pseudomonadota bacterium]|jgi:hypothetical protein